jgi:hypothetical protein
MKSASYHKLDAKITRFRERQRHRVERWKDILYSRVLERTDAASHADLVEAMLEIAIDWKIAHLGADNAEDLTMLAFKRRAGRSRDRRN